MSYEVLLAHPYDFLLNIIQHCQDIILIDNAIIIPIMDHIILTCNSINIQLCVAKLMTCCRMFLLHVGNPHMGNFPYLIVISIYVGVSGSYPRYIKRIRFCHMKFCWHIHTIFSPISSSKDRILSLSTML